MAGKTGGTGASGNGNGAEGQPVSEDAPVLVWLHGSGDSGAVWREVVHALPEFTSVALDLPGHGALIERPGPDRMGVSEYADAVRSELTRRGLRGVCLIGHSLGSAISLQLSLDHPALVRRVVLIGAGARLRVLPALLALARENPAAAQAQLDTLAFSPGHESLRETTERARAPLAAGMLSRDLLACDAFDLMNDLRRIEQPTLLVTGADDKLTPPKYATYLGDHMEHAQVVLVPGAGHYVMLEAPERVARAIRAFLAHDRRGAQPAKRRAPAQ